MTGVPAAPDESANLAARGNSRLGIGTVQFGQPYGITNANGQVSELEVGRILTAAAAAGVHLIDTASLYGTSEAVLGKTLATAVPWQIVTKSPKFGDVRSPADAEARLRQSFAQSLQRLRRNAVTGLLVHDADDLLSPNGGALWGAMTELKVAGQVAKIGASVYTAAQIDGILERYPVDLVQLPFNALDARLIRAGSLARLSAAGVEVHARSVFLQGLILAAPAEIHPSLGALRAPVAGLQAQFAAHGLTPLEGALACVLRRSEISHIVLGLTSHSEFLALLSAIKTASEHTGQLDIESFEISDERLLSPAAWGQLPPRGSLLV